jgi:hypothetical protein
MEGITELQQAEEEIRSLNTILEQAIGCKMLQKLPASSHARSIPEPTQKVKGNHRLPLDKTYYEFPGNYLLIKLQHCKPDTTAYPTAYLGDIPFYMTNSLC